MDKKKMNRNYYLPFLILGVLMLAYHVGIQVGYGDDTSFGNIATGKDFSLISYCITRYKEWTSRTFIEAIMMTILQLPAVIWKVLDTILITLTSVFMMKTFCSREHVFEKSCIVVLLTLTLNYSWLSSAGWIATTLNYNWPLAAGMVAMYSLRKLLDGREMKWWECIIYAISLLFAASAEQMCVILFIACVAVVIIQKHRTIFLWVQMSLSTFSLLYMFLCPGNYGRDRVEAPIWFPYYVNFGILKKVELGISNTLNVLLLQNDYCLLLFVVVLTLAIWLKYEDRFYRLLSGGLLVLVATFQYLYLSLDGQAFPFDVMNEIGMFREETIGQKSVFLAYVGLLFICCLVVINIYILYGNRLKTLLVIACFLLGLMTKAMLGFSPTIWASGNRTEWLMLFALICATVCVIDDWEFDKKDKAIPLYLLVLTAGGIGTLEFIRQIVVR